MGLSQRFELRQAQGLTMTPQLLQAIKLLQLSSLELSAYVEAELERNPLLERAETEAADGPVQTPETPAPFEEPREGDWLREDVTPDRAAIESELGTSLDNTFPDEAGVGAEARTREAPAPGDGLPMSASPWGPGGSEDAPDMEAFVAARPSLRAHLLGQLDAARDAGLAPLARVLVDALDAAGYLCEPLHDIAERLGAPLGRAEAALRLVQELDPTGVGARDLAECLALQLREADRFDPAMAALVANLPLLARRDYAGLRRVCGVDDADLAEMCAEVRRLNPKPGLAFESSPMQLAVPDAFVRPAPDGSWSVELNPETLPRVLVNGTYHATVRAGARRPEDKAYLDECLTTASWLARSLDQRARTILKVAAEIARQQDGFLTYGVEHLRPLNLRTVADAIGMHESTVSRVTSNKYLATGRGLFEMKYFFTAAIPDARGGEAHSAEAVRHRLRRIVDGEGADGVLSDDALVGRLRGEGVDIARRTVAKYRESLGIPSSMDRRRDKLARAAAE